MTALSRDWTTVRGDWTPMSNSNPPIPLKHDSPELINRLTELGKRITTAFPRRADYSKIGLTKQRQDEAVTDFRNRFEVIFQENCGIAENADVQSAYQQQLKQTLLEGLRPEISQWIRKHFVTLPTSSLSEFMDYATHAEKIVVNKKKQSKYATDVFYHDDFEESDTYSYVQDYETQRDRFGARAGSRYNMRQGTRSNGGHCDSCGHDRLCWFCGRSGHWKRDCPEQRERRA